MGQYKSRCDDKGRVRLPKEFEDFLKTLSDTEFFVTTVDESTGRIYPLSTWFEIEKKLEDLEDDPDGAGDLIFLAQHWGSVATIDSQGRLLVPPDLRRKLGIENQPVSVAFSHGAITLYGDTAYQQRLERASDNAPAKASALRKKGIREL